MHLKSFALLALLSAAALGQATLIWDESIHGDLTDDRFAPNNFALANGSNTIIGSTGFSDRDYFHFSLAPGQSLTHIYLRAYQSIDDVSFLGVQAGTTFTEDPLNANVGNLLGWTFFGGPELGQDLLPLMGSNFGSMGFTGPLTGSDYTFWLQQTGDPTTYELEFVAVPEPATLAVVGLGALLLRRRRKS